MHDTRGRVPGRDPRPDDRPDGLDDRQRRERLRAGQVRARRASTCTSRRTPSTRCTAPRASTRACRGPRTPTTSPSRTRSATSSTATRSRRTAATAPSRRPAIPTPRRRRHACFNAGDSLLVQIGGCIGADNDFDGSSYQHVWPGTARRRAGPALHPTPILFTSPLFNGQPELQPGGVRDRPAADRGGGLRRRAATVSPGTGAPTRHRERRSTRSSRPAPRRATRARTDTASGRRVVRTSRERPTSSAETPLRSTGRCCSASTRAPIRLREPARTTITAR